ncbi:MAG: 30S ribosomal protein S9, partial [Thermomicrobium sp.]
MVETARTQQATGTKPLYYYGLGRRKTAVARVRLYPGTGQIIINGRPAAQYFGNRLLYHVMITEPLRLTGLQDHFDIRARV